MNHYFIMLYNLTAETMIIFVVFIVFVFLIYKLFRVLMKGALVAGAGFSFPWIVEYLGLPLDITANIDTGIEFATAALTVYIIYEFFHFIKYFFKVLAWPFKTMLGKKK